jgi:hypothetical protein
MYVLHTFHACSPMPILLRSSNRAHLLYSSCALWKYPFFADGQSFCIPANEQAL